MVIGQGDVACTIDGAKVSSRAKKKREEHSFIRLPSLINEEEFSGSIGNDDPSKVLYARA